MAKEFKNFDKVYAKYAGKILEGEEVSLWETKHIKHRKYRHNLSTVFGTDKVRHAVYASETASEWQKFRVSLKGQSTELKLHRLERRYERMQAAADKDEFELERIRIGNYIGALRRGGQLNEDMEIMK